MTNNLRTSKTLKAAGAAVAAGVLLLGGAGTLAYWSADASVTGDDIAAGQLSLTGAACDETWVLNGGTAYTTGTLIVPGDTLTKECSYTITATGENLQADLTANEPAGTGLVGATLGAAYTVDDPTDTTDTPAAVTQITEDNDGDVLTATLTVDFPYGTEVDNTSQGMSATLDAYTITAEQTDASPVAP